MLPLYLVFRQRRTAVPSVAVVLALLTTYPPAVRQKDANGCRQAGYAESHPNVPPLCSILFRNAAVSAVLPHDEAAGPVTRQSCCSLRDQHNGAANVAAVNHEYSAAASTSPWIARSARPLHDTTGTVHLGHAGSGDLSGKTATTSSHRVAHLPEKGVKLGQG